MIDGISTGISRFVGDEVSQKLIGNRKRNTRCMIKEKER